MPLPSDAFMQTPAMEFVESRHKERVLSYLCSQTGLSNMGGSTMVDVIGPYAGFDRAVRIQNYPGLQLVRYGFPGLTRTFVLDFECAFTLTDGKLPYPNNVVSFTLKRFDQEGVGATDYLAPPVEVIDPETGEVIGLSNISSPTPTRPTFEFKLSEIAPGVVYRRTLIIPPELGYCHPNFNVFAYDGPTNNGYFGFSSNNTGGSSLDGLLGWIHAGVNYTTPPGTVVWKSAWSV